MIECSAAGQTTTLMLAPLSQRCNYPAYLRTPFSFWCVTAQFGLLTATPATAEFFIF
jgi:hypothetical protein